MTVTVHFLAVIGKEVEARSTLALAQQMRLIVKPGIATEASPCQTNVSNTACIIFVRFTELDGHVTCTEEAQTNYACFLYKKNEKAREMYVILSLNCLTSAASSPLLQASAQT